MLKMHQRLKLRMTTRPPEAIKHLVRARCEAVDSNGRIPLVGIATLSNTIMLERLLGALDHPISDLAIVQNGPDRQVADMLAEFAKGCRLVHTRFRNTRAEAWQPGYFPSDVETRQCRAPPSACIHRLTLFQNEANRGCAQAWNLILRYGWRQGASYTIIMNDDVTFAPRELAKFHAHVTGRLEAADVAARGAFFTWPTQSGWQNFSCFALTRAAISPTSVGLFDENIFPAYYEDYELKLRMNLKGLRMESVPNASYIHGLVGTASTYTGHYLIESSQRRELHLMALRASSAFYLASKWGLYVQFDRFEWGHWTDKSPATLLDRQTDWFQGFERRMPRYQGPWNAQRPVAFWKVDEGRQRFIRTGVWTSNGPVGANESDEASTRQIGAPTVPLDADATADVGESTSGDAEHGTTHFHPTAQPLIVFDLQAASGEVARLLQDQGISTLSRLKQWTQYFYSRVQPVVASVIDRTLGRLKVNSTTAMVMAANGSLGQLIRSRAFTHLGRQRLQLEHVLSVHTAHPPWALAVHAWSELLLPLIRDLLVDPICVVVMRPPPTAAHDAAAADYPELLWTEMLLWEMHILGSLHACAGLRKVLLPGWSEAALRDAVAQLPAKVLAERRREVGGGPQITPTRAAKLSPPRVADDGRWPHSVRSLWDALVREDALGWTVDQIPPHGSARARNNRARMEEVWRLLPPRSVPFDGICCNVDYRTNVSSM